MNNKLKVLGGFLAALMVVPTGAEAAEQATVRKMTMREKVESIRCHDPFSIFYRPQKEEVKVVESDCSPLMRKAKDKNPKSFCRFKKGKPARNVSITPCSVSEASEETAKDISVKPSWLPTLNDDEKVVSDSDKILRKFKDKKARRIRQNVQEKKASETDELISESARIREKIAQKLKFCKDEVSLKYVGTGVSLDSEKVAEEVKKCMTSPDCEYRKKLEEKKAESMKEAIAPAKPVQKLEKQNVLIIEDNTVNDDYDMDKTVDDCKYYTYKSGEKTLVVTYPGIITDIVLQPGETIERITVGDKHRWEIDTYNDVSANGSQHVYVQPIQEGLSTNMIILTDRRTYQVALETSVFYDSIVAWKYPGESNVVQQKKEAVMEVESADLLTFDYSISNRKNFRWAPKFIFDDGFNMYIAIDPDEIAKNPPAIFTENIIGNLVLVDYELVDDNIIINKVYKNLQIRVKDDIIKVLRINND